MTLGIRTRRDDMEIISSTGGTKSPTIFECGTLAGTRHYVGPGGSRNAEERTNFRSSEPRHPQARGLEGDRLHSSQQPITKITQETGWDLITAGRDVIIMKFVNEKLVNQTWLENRRALTNTIFDKEHIRQGEKMRKKPNKERPVQQAV